MERPALPLLLGVDIGGTTLRVAVTRSPRGGLRRRSRPTPSRSDGSDVADLVAAAARDLSVEAGGAPVAAGIAFAGPVDTRAGRVVGAPNIPGFADVPFREMLAARLGIPVALENDATAAALAEHRLGAGRGVRDMVYVAIGTGIGGGIICAGRLYRGAVGGAGELGHMTVLAEGPLCACGNRGCWEALAGGWAMARDARSRLAAGEPSLLAGLAGGDPGRPTARDVSEAADRGDAVAISVLERASYYLGVGLANVVNIFNPEVVVLGGGLTQIGDLLLAPALRVARERALRLHAGAVRMTVSALGDDAGLRGALLLAQGLRPRRR